ncbi:MAG: RluA family pseudouridine synthase [Sphaerochaetaceae bacterium]
MTIDEFRNRILYEDNHLLIINKLPGDLVQGDQSGDVTLADEARTYLKEAYGKEGNIFLGIPHRLDRPTSGVVIYTKTEKALKRMHALFRAEGAVEKIYWAVVDSLPLGDEGLVVHYLTRNRVKNRSYATVEEKRGSQLAKLSYTIKGASKAFYLLEIELITGRHHQIRAQLNALGSSIKGDLKYGSRRSNKGGGIHLHARQVSFIHPVRQERVTVIAPPPKDPLWDYFVTLLS